MEIGSNSWTGHGPREITITSFRTRYESWIHLRTVRSWPVYNVYTGSWVAVDTVYDVYETVTFIYAALSSHWVTSMQLATKSIVYYLRFTIERNDHEISGCRILNGMSSGASIRKYSMRGRFIGRERTVHVLCIEFMVVGISTQLTMHFSSFSPPLLFFSFSSFTSFYLFKCGISYKSLMLQPLLSKLLLMFINFSPFLPRKATSISHK